MYEDRYDLSDPERREVQETLADMSLRGGRLADAAGRPIPYRVLRGRRFLVCDRGLVWRHVPAGAPHVPGQYAGTARRNSAVEMWTGRWRKASAPDGTETYAKCLVWVPLDDNINGHPGISKLGWYRSEKGFSHPLAAPHAPTAQEIETLEGRKRAATDAVYARMQAEGLSPPDATDAGDDGTEQPRKRSRRRAP